MKHLDTIFKTLLMPFSASTPWPAMFALSFLTSLAVMIIFKYTSNQSQLKKSKGVLIGRLLELHLFRHDLMENMRAFGRVMAANVLYLKVFLKPMIIAIVPMVIIFLQAEDLFTYRPLRPGETTLVSIDFKDNTPVISTAIETRHSDNIEITAPPVRIPELNQAVWRIEVKNAAPAWIETSSENETFRAEVKTGAKLSRIKSKIEGNDPVTLLTIDYPRHDFSIAGKTLHWILIYVVLTLVFALPLKKVLGVEI